MYVFKYIFKNAFRTFFFFFSGVEIKTIKSNVYSPHLIKMFICLINKESVIIMYNICQNHSYYYLPSGEDLCTIYLLCLIFLCFLFPEDHL